MSGNILTLKRLKEALDYDSQTGIFTRKTATSNNKMKAGAVAGTLKTSGYMQIRIDGKIYLTHRLAWLYVYGVWPKNQIHHLNKVTTDNRIVNLKDVTARENCSDRKIHDTGRLVGTVYHKRDKKWQAGIYVEGKIKHIGYFDTEQQAHEAYTEALQSIA